MYNTPALLQIKNWAVWLCHSFLCCHIYRSYRLKQRIPFLAHLICGLWTVVWCVVYVCHFLLRWLCISLFNL